MRALLVEDDDAIAEFVGRGLREAGFAVDREGDGEAGLSAAMRQPYDVAVVDVMLPKRDGLSMIEELRRRKVLTPVLILSARRAVDDRVRGLQSGGDDYLGGSYEEDHLYGGKGNDWLYGSRGEDVLIGGSGNDTLHGGNEADLLEGGSGADTFFYSGLKVAVTLAVIGAVVGEFVGSDKGLGYVIVSATSYWKSNLAFAAMLLLASMAVALFALVELCERLVCPWTTAAREQPEPAAE